jgi:hypothetical protein
MELTTELGCYWDPTSPNLDPASTYHRLPNGCKYANGVGILVLVSAFLGAYALTDLTRFYPQMRNAAMNEDIKVGLLTL